MQYVAGTAQFGGLTFEVSPGVLIPRPETLELVEWAAGDFSTRTGKGNRHMRVLDIGTGSGCIAVTMAVRLAGAQVTAVDISEKALGVARRNAARNGVQVEFAVCDILSPGADIAGNFDVIMSNPPYVCRSERAGMHRNVLDHEPGCALFVPDRDPLVFYRAIVVTASRHLAKGGFGAVEINEALGREVSGLFSGAGFRNVEVRKDLSGRDRFVFFDAP